MTQHEFDTVGVIAGCAIFIDRRLAGDYGNAVAIAAAVIGILWQNGDSAAELSPAILRPIRKPG